MEYQNQNKWAWSYGKRAKIALNGQLMISAGIVFLLYVVPGFADSIVDPEYGIFGIIINPIIFIGLPKFFLNIRKGKHADIQDIIFIFQSWQIFIQSVCLYILISIGIGIGLVLLVVPGVIFGLGVSQAVFIFIENPEITCVEAMKRSWIMMQGKKIDMFILCLIAILWLVLGLLCLIVGIFFAIPFVGTMWADFYLVNGFRRQGQFNNISGQYHGQYHNMPGQNHNMPEQYHNTPGSYHNAPGDIQMTTQPHPIA